MLQRDYPTQYCPVAGSLEVVGERWTLLIVRDVFLGIRRFEDLQRDLGVARNVLQARLERLVENGILVKRPYQERPLRCEYRLTEKGADLWPVLVALLTWGDRYAIEGERPMILQHRACGGELDDRRRCTACGADVSVTEAIAVRTGAARPAPAPGPEHGAQLLATVALRDRGHCLAGRDRAGGVGPPQRSLAGRTGRRGHRAD